MKKILLTAITILLTLPVFTRDQSPAFLMNERLGRGINMGNAFEAPSETAWGNPWQPDYFRRMAELGFTHVRVPIRWEPAGRSMASAPYTIHSTFMNRIKSVVDNALQNKLHVIINMHHHDTLFANPDAQKERFLSQWSQISDFFKDYPDSLLFEPLNEPHGSLTAEKWNEFANEAVKRIRETNPDRTVVIGTADWGGLGGLPKLVLPDDQNLILTIHYYNPFTFTHQGAEWVDGANAWLGTKWHDTEAERQTMKNEFQYAIDFGKTHNIPIHIGEFGAYSRADIDSRVRWTTFMARWFEEQGFSWAYWEFSAGFGIYNRNTGQYLTPLVDALLHNPMPEPVKVIATNLYTSNFSASRDGWSLNFGGGASGSLANQDGKLVANISSSGSESWHVQLIRSNISLKKGVMYRVSFRASAAGDRSATSYIGLARDPWTSYSGYIGVTLGAEEKEYSYAFTMAADDNQARLVFDLGLSNVNFTLSHLAIDELEFATSVPDSENSIVAVVPYPNPVKDTLFIDNLTGFTELSVIDTQGRLVMTTVLSHERYKLETSSLKPGIYFGRLKGASQSGSFVFLKQ